MAATSTSSLELIINNICPFAQRSWLAVEELGVPCKIRETPLQNKPAWFSEEYAKALGADPTSDGKVPILIDGDFHLAESAPICAYLLQKFGPVSGDTMQHDFNPCPSAFENAHIAIYFEQVLTGKLFPAHMALLRAKEPEAAAAAKTSLLSAYAAVSAAYDRFPGAYFLGDKVSFADLVTWPILDRLRVLKHYRGFTIEDQPEFAGINRYVQSRRWRRISLDRWKFYIS